MADIPTLHRILADSHSIAVVGLSANWHRPSFFAAKYLQDHGYRVIPVNPAYDEVLGQTCYPTLESIPEPVDVVDCFRRAAKVLWLQLGVVNETAAAIARTGGLEVVMDRCMKIEHARLFGGLNFIGVNTGLISSRRARHLV